MHLGVNRSFGATVVALLVCLQVTAEFSQLRAPEFSCEEGYSLEGTFCVKIIQEKSTPVCHWGFLKEGFCVEEFSSIYTCPPQYKLNKLTNFHKLTNTKKATARRYKFKPVPQEPECSRKIMEAPIPKCPVEYEFDGMLCQKETIVDPVCPRGTEQTAEGRCAHYKPPSRRCLEGYIPCGKNHRKSFTKGTKCLKVSQDSAMPICRDGYSFTGEQCEKVESVPPMCPNGSKEVADNKCAYYKKAEMRCPYGFKRYTSRKECSKFVTVESYPVCMDGYELIASQKWCRKVENLPLVCPRNTEEVDGNCVNYTSPSRVCPPDFVTSDEGICVKKVSAIRTCDTDYELDGNACVRTVSIPPVCPVGAIEDSEHECAVFHSSQSKCPDGFERNRDDKCVQEMNHEALVACTKGFTLTGRNRCEKIVTIQPDTICQKGARQGRDCVEYISVPLQYECPADYERKGNGCTRIMEYDCSTVEYETKCKSTLKVREECNSKECEMNYSHVSRLRSLGSYFNHNNYLASPFKFHRESSPFKFHRESPFNIQRESRFSEFPFNQSESRFSESSFDNQRESDQMCEKVVSSKKQLRCRKRFYADAISSCPPDSQAEGEGCVVAKKSLPDFVCKDGFDLQGSQCVRTLTKDPVYNCPDNYVMMLPGDLNLFSSVGSLYQTRHKCLKVEVREPFFYCEKGEMVNNRCVSYLPKKCPNDICERRVSVPVNYGCVAGFNLSSPFRDERAKNAPCVSRETVSPRLVCNRGVLEPENGRCAQFYDKVCPLGGCEKISTMIPKRKCPPGFKGSKTCTAIETADVEYYCSEVDGVLERRQCVLYVDKRCPRGQCTVRRFKPVNFECPNGFSMRKTALLPYFSAFELETMFPEKKDIPTCFLIDWSDMELYCTEGEMTYGDRCGVYVDKECPNGGDCRRMYTLEPSYDCPEGYKIPVPHKRNGRTIVGSCEKTIFIPAKINCQKGLVSESGKCIKTTTPEYVCLSEEATIAADGTCSLKVYEKPTQIVRPIAFP